MPSTFHFCLPTGAAAVPDHPVWLHEVEYDGYSLRLDREANRVRLFTRNGYDWTDRRPWIVEAALKNRHKRFVIDGEAVILGVGGISNFNPCTHAGMTRKSSSTASTACRSTARISGAAAIHTQDRPRPPISAPTRWNLYCAV